MTWVGRVLRDFILFCVMLHCRREIAIISELKISAKTVKEIWIMNHRRIVMGRFMFFNIFHRFWLKHQSKTTGGRWKSKLKYTACKMSVILGEILRLEQTDFKIIKEEKGIYLDDLLNYEVIFGIMHTK